MSESLRAEQKWWGNCVNTVAEETKQLQYAKRMGLNQYHAQGTGLYIPPFDLRGQSVLDIGGGPVSLLLKCVNLGKAVIIDPGEWPRWVMDRYSAAGIEYVQRPAEGADLGEKFDEVWLYNVLQHVESPEAVIATALRHGRTVRVFEWLGVPSDTKHPHCLVKADLDRWLGVNGATMSESWGANVQSYSAIVPPRPGFRFHLLGLAHVPTVRKLSCCAYTQKIVKLATMLKSLGHEVLFYGVEGSAVDCDEFVQVLSETDRRKVYGEYNWRTEFFRYDGRDAAHDAFRAAATEAIRQRELPGDILLCTMGLDQKPIADALPNMVAVEPGIGYEGIFSRFRAFESYAWMHYLYGRTGQADGGWYDAVIPNYFDPADFPFQPDKSDYALFIGRIVKRKGVEVAVQVTKALGMRLVMAGQGTLKNETEGLNITDSHVDFIGSVGPEERKELIGRAKFALAPTYYIEPFGGVAIEAMLCGTPVLTTDWGAFTETVQHGVTGYRCRTMDDFLWAARNVETISPADCRSWALANYSMDRVKLMFQEWFQKIRDIRAGGWYERHDDRNELDWLRKHQVGGK
ncbi:MAG TPA: glycosyltransferase [Anaerolineae bacterium]|nr:glycosyltransferase [Anaerolineae bacterium]HUW13382.1 glycosyltransferase [Anaerolineae bacterium]